MKSVAATIFFDSGIDPDLFARYSLQIGDKDWWDTVGIIPPQIADERSGMMCIRASRLLLIVSNVLRVWNVFENDALDLLGVTDNAHFETIMKRSRQVFFISTYAVLAFSSNTASSDTWLHRPNRHWNGERPLEVMLKQYGGLGDVLTYLEDAVSPVTYLTEDMK